MHCGPRLDPRLFPCLFTLFNTWVKLVIFSPICVPPPPPPLCYFMPQQLNGTQLSCCRLQENLVSGFSSNVTCCILAEEKGQQGRACDCLVEPCSLFTPPQPAPLCFLLCRRANSNDLPPLCRAPSAWPWA